MTFSALSLLQKLLIVILIVAGLYYAREFLMPLAIAGVLATLFLPFCKWMEKRKVPKVLAVLVCILVLLSAITGIVWLLSWQVSQLASDFETIKQKFTIMLERIQQYLFTHFGISAEKQSQAIKDQQFSFSGIFQVIAGSAVSLLTTLILTFAYIFLLLYYRSHLRKFLLKLSPPSNRNELSQVINDVVNVSQQYLTGLSKMIMCLWIMYGISFSIIGVKNPLFFAFLCGVLEIIPFIGNITGTTVTLLVTAVQGGSPAMLLAIVGTYGLVQFIQGWVLEPLIVGPHVKINPFSTIIALVLGEMLWGIPGIFLAIPLVAMFKIVCDHTESLKPYGYLIGEVVDGKGKINFAKKIKGWFKKRKS